MKTLSTIITFFSLLSFNHLTAVMDSDNAANGVYSNGWNTLDDGSHSGEGLGGWVFDEDLVRDGINVGIETSTGNSSSGSIDTNGVAFKIHDDTGMYIEVFRFIDTHGLEIGETLSLDLCVNFRGGNKGIDFRDPDEQVILNLNIGGDDYVINDAETGNGSLGATYASDTVFRIQLTQEALEGGTWKIIRSGHISNIVYGTYKGRIRSFKFYSGGQGVAAEDAMFVNNIEIIEG